MQETAEPEDAGDHQECACPCGGQQVGSEAGGEFAAHPARGERGQRIGEEEAAGGSEKLGHAAEAAGCEDGQAQRAFEQVKHHGREARRWSKGEADEDHGEVAEREGHGREGDAHRSVGAERDEDAGGDGEQDLAGNGFGLQTKRRSGEGSGGAVRLGCVHRCTSFQKARRFQAYQGVAAFVREHARWVCVEQRSAAGAECGSHVTLG